MYGRQFTDQERQFITDNAHQGAAWVAQQIGITYEQARSYFSRHHLKSGINSQFKKGENRGHKWQKGQQVSPATQFKKGAYRQTAPEGDLTVSSWKDRRGVVCLMIRKSVNKWDYLSRYVWETFFGLIPPRHIVIFRDSDTLNCHPDNLMLIDRKQNARRNHNPQKAAETIQQGRASDQYYASRLYMKDKPMQAFVLEYAPDLVEVKRQELKLRHQLKTIEAV